MSNTKHTPGPWVVERDLNGELAVFQRDGAHLTHGESGKPLPEREANAQLMAAAPELLEALRECITEGGAHCFHHEATSTDLERRIDAITRIARAAIEQAEGKKS